MALNQTPAGERVHIGFFGRRNAGKSSLMNAVTGQELAVVSEVKGTTTDPVSKTMELLPLGPVMVIDTPGIDDEGELGDLRVRKSRQVLNKTDIAVLVVDGTVGETKEDMELLALFHEKQVPYLVVYHKADLLPEAGAGKSGERNKEKSEQALAGKVLEEKSENSHPVLYVSSKTGLGIEDLKNRLAAMKPFKEEKDLLEGLVRPGDLVVLVTPIDKAAPKGRLILPQQQTIRALLDHGCVSMAVRETELEHMLKKIGQKPALVITDSQAFSMVSSIVPKDIPLTSFSILFARYKGDLRQAVAGVKALERIQDGDKILISEGCTHHRQCNDIGTVKLPGWIRSYTGREPEFVYTSGTGFQEDLKAFRVIVHCGACMLNEREMKYRLACARDQGVDITNYGIVIAHIHGILKRSLGPFPDIEALLED
ncbi:[FeFe] hydrogenase H-cluster maturation GTPase HydF [bacterium D16-54]|jgi:[FeFe] hydrogenase H-cluster maturation GTPase HydF|nr:[FeFe] hydrogenase H-cluster maturation GTPase HydF [bacterium D16-54]RKJ11409.1 [FeFe] hydrogenase H-cluster maturation GTPase HydF [bacterium D16-56]